MTAGATPPKSPDASDALKYVELTGSYRIRGYTCNRIEVSDGANQPYSSVYKATSLRHYGTRILVDGVYWMPVASGVIAGWELAS